MDKRDSAMKFVSQYETIIYLGIFPPSFIFVGYIYFGKHNLINNLYPYTTIIGLLLAITLAIIIGRKEAYIFKITTFRSDFLKIFFTSLIFIPIFLYGFVKWTNIILDSSKQIERLTVVKSKNEINRTRRGRKKSYRNINVRSWINTKEEISIDVNKTQFDNIKKGDFIKIYTRNGFWGLEYIER